MEIKQERQTEFPIYKGVLYNCCFCHTNFISLNFIQKHQLKCQHSIIHSILKKQLTLNITLRRRVRKEKEQENSLNSKTNVANLLPQRSAKIYKKQYDAFLSWSRNNNVNNYSENVFLAYFYEKAKILKSSSLWSIYSMLKSMFIMKHNFDISKFIKLTAFIKRENLGYIPKKTNIFTRENINKFLIEAPDENYLMLKVCLIFGVAGACRMDELKKMALDDVQDMGNILIVTITDFNTGKRRTFTITNEMCEDVNPIELFRKYLSLRPSHTPHKYFFVFYRLGKCTIQPVGVQSFSKIPTQIANFLNLPNANTYKGQAFRKTSKSLLTNTSFFEVTLKQHRA